MSQSLREIDGRIAALTAEIDTTGASLAELDNDLNLKLLASATLAGRTAAEWQAAAPKLARLWAYFTALKDKLAEIVALRGTRPRLNIDQLNALSNQLWGNSVVIPPDPGAPGTRSLTANQQIAAIGWVQAAMAAMFRDVVSVVDRVGAAWAALPQLDALDATLTGLSQNASQSGIKPPAEIPAARSLITSLRDELMADPLAADLRGVETIARQVTSAGEVLRSALAARGEMGQRLSQAADALEATGDLIARAQAAAVEGAGKIAGQAQRPGELQGLAERLSRLRVNLESITALSRSNWQEATRLLGQLGQQAAALQEEAGHALAAVQGPLEARNELRGRLDAYHAKAQAIGRAEDELLSALYERAKQLLFTAPCDVAGAQAAVKAYQAGLGNPGLGNPARPTGFSGVAVPSPDQAPRPF